MAEALERTLRPVLSGPCAVIGHSLGGAVALVLAARAPDLIDRAVLIAPLGLGGGIDRDFVSRLPELGSQEEALLCLKRLVVRDRLISPQMADHVLAALADTTRRAHLRRIARAILDTGEPAIPPGLATTVIWGEADRINPLDRPRLDRLGLSVHVLAETGHVPPMEAPRKTTDLIAAALKTSAG